MPLRKHTAYLQVIEGSNKGKRFELKKTSITLGSADCDFILTGKYISREHAVLEKVDDKQWVLLRISVNDTQVNKRKIDKKILHSGDLIQLGTETILSFSVENNQSNSKDTKDNSETLTEGISTQMALCIGIGFNVLLLCALLYFSDSKEPSTKTGNLSQETAYKIVEYTQKQLLSNSQSGCGGFDSIINTHSVNYDDGNKQEGGYDKLLNIKKSSPNQEYTIEQVKKLTDRLDAYWFQAWRLEGQKQWSDAIHQYLAIAKLLPDIRCHSTQLAMTRIALLQKKLNHE